jgi:hypothetical protein
MRLQDIIDKTATVKLISHNMGEWGGISLGWELKWANLTQFFNMIFNTEPQELTPTLTCTSAPEKARGYVGLVLRGGEKMPGMFALGYSHPLAGKFYTGELSVGDTANKIRHYGLPSLVFADLTFYLHIDAETAVSLTQAQRQLLLEAVRFDRDSRFAAGQSVTKLFSRDELEGTQHGKVFYA